MLHETRIVHPSCGKTQKESDVRKMKGNFFYDSAVPDETISTFYCNEREQQNEELTGPFKRSLPCTLPGARSTVTRSNSVRTE